MRVLVCIYTCHEHASQRASIESTELMRGLRADHRYRVVDVHADARLAAAQLTGDTLTVPCRESYDCLSIKTFLMVQAALAMLPHFDALLKVDATLARYSEQPHHKSANMLARLSPEAAQRRVGDPAFLAAPYNGLIEQRASKAGFEKWLRTKGLTGDFTRVFGASDATPPYFVGKLYSLRRDVCQYVAAQGAPMAHEHPMHLAGCEDVMIGRLVDAWARS
jgi:hypothetical protein